MERERGKQGNFFNKKGSDSRKNNHESKGNQNQRFLVETKGRH